MKTQSTNLQSEMSKTAIENLTAEVKETLAFGYNHTYGKTFSAADLWNIQRRHKTINPRRRYGF